MASGSKIFWCTNRAGWVISITPAVLRSPTREFHFYQQTPFSRSPDRNQCRSYGKKSKMGAQVICGRSNAQIRSGAEEYYPVLQGKPGRQIFHRGYRPAGKTPTGG